MQGCKKFTPKLFFDFYLPDHIPEDNFYKILKKELDLSFICKATKGLYSHTGKPSIDPVMFFKCLLIGYLENLCSDRALERTVRLRLDLLYFIDHDIGEAPPDDSAFINASLDKMVEVKMVDQTAVNKSIICEHNDLCVPYKSRPYLPLKSWN